MRKQPIEPAREFAGSWSQAEFIAAAAAIANARAMRRGILPKENVLDLLRPFGGGQLYREVLEDATAALLAAEQARHKTIRAARHEDWAPISANVHAPAALTQDAA